MQVGEGFLKANSRTLLVETSMLQWKQVCFYAFEAKETSIYVKLSTFVFMLFIPKEVVRHFVLQQKVIKLNDQFKKSFLVETNLEPHLVINNLFWWKQVCLSVNEHNACWGRLFKRKKVCFDAFEPRESFFWW